MQIDASCMQVVMADDDTMDYCYHLLFDSLHSDSTKDNLKKTNLDKDVLCPQYVFVSVLPPFELMILALEFWGTILRC